MAAGTDGLTVGGRAERVGRILDDPYWRVERRAQLANRCRETCEMNGDDELRRTAHRRANGLRRHVESGWIDVGEARRRTEIRAAVGARCERERARHELVPHFDSGRERSPVE